MIPVVEQRGRTYVAATDMEPDAHIAVKTLPGNDTVVVCAQERCALVKDYLRKGDEIFVSTTAKAAGLCLSTHFSDDRKSVTLTPDLMPLAGDRLASVGELAPNFRMHNPEVRIV